ncbi:uncharacterized protein C8Q71DRAFT_737197, partial [Rhodofomes roseus]
MMNPPQRANQSQECQNHKASRLRGGGAGKDCFIGAFECFICFEGCKDCCECCADIICASPPSYLRARSLTRLACAGCPCEMCC